MLANMACGMLGTPMIRRVAAAVDSVGSINGARRPRGLSRRKLTAITVATAPSAAPLMNTRRIPGAADNDPPPAEAPARKPAMRGPKSCPSDAATLCHPNRESCRSGSSAFAISVCIETAVSIWDSPRTAIPMPSARSESAHTRRSATKPTPTDPPVRKSGSPQRSTHRPMKTATTSGIKAYDAPITPTSTAPAPSSIARKEAIGLIACTAVPIRTLAARTR